MWLLKTSSTNLTDTFLFFSFSVNKQINDKERIAAAMENPNLKKIVEECISDESWSKNTAS